MILFLFIFLLLLVAYTFIIEHYRTWWRKTSKENTQPPTSLSTSTKAEENFAVNTFVSVVVAVRNEQSRVETLLTHLAAQDYPHSHFEVLIVNDHSEDDTWRIVMEFATKHKNIKPLNLPFGTAGKKNAIAFAIGQSSGELIITTDADCIFSPLWISCIVHCYVQTGAKFIVGPVIMTSEKSLLGIFQQLDYLALQGITAASVSSKLHSLCSGANLAYKKTAFLDVNGFEGVDGIPSGDDMLLMQKIVSRYPQDVVYLKNKEAIVETPVEPTWRKFLHQRIRWASKSVHYTEKKIFYILLITYLVNLSFVVLAIASVMHPHWLWLLVLFFCMKVIIEFPFVNDVSAFFGLRRLMWFFPLFQPLHILYVVVAGWLGRFGSYEWKSRIIKNKGRTKMVKH